MADKQEIINQFLESATVNILKQKLRKLNQSTVGNKAALILRLEEAWMRLNTDEVTAQITDYDDVAVHMVESDESDDDGNLNQIISQPSASTSSESQPNGVHQPSNGNAAPQSSGCSNSRGRVSHLDGSKANDGSSTGANQRLNVSSQLDNEIYELQKILEKRQKIVELKKQLSLLEESENLYAKNQCFSFKDIEGSLPPFSGDDHLSIEKWITIFEENADALGWDQKLRLVFAKRLMCGTAQLFLRTCVIHSWDELKFELKREFCRKISKAEIHEKLRNRKKSRDETFHQYVLNMQEIASFSDIDEYDIVKYIIAGIPDAEVNKIILYHANSIHELKIALKNYEILKSNQNSTRDLHYQFKQKQLSYLPKNKQNFKNNDEHQLHNSVKTQHYKHRNHNYAFTNHENNECNRNVKTQHYKHRNYNHAYTNHGNNECNRNNSKNIMNVQSSATDDTQITDAQDHSSKLVVNSFLSADEFEHDLEFKFLGDGIENASYTTTLRTLLDSGSPISFVQEKYVPPSLIILAGNNERKYHGINGSPLCIIGEIKCNINFNNNFINIKLFVVKDFTMYHSVILGRDFLKSNNMILMKNKQDEQTKYVNKKDGNKNDTQTTEQKKIYENLPDILSSGTCKNITDKYDGILDIQILEDSSEINLNICDNLPHNIKNEIYNIVKKTWTQVQLTNNNLSSENINLEIKLIKDEPFYTTPRRLPYSHLLELRKIINDLLQQNIIRESNSPYASPIVLVKKKSGDLRLCVDYRELNKLTIRDNYPLPLIDDILDRLRDKKYFTTLDLRNGFHNVDIAPDSIKYTSFVTPIGQFEYLKMPFGLKNAPSVFQRYINRIFKPLIESGQILIFLDDFMIATESVDEHLQILKQVVDILNVHSLKLRYDKCRFMFNEVNYLGYTLNASGIKPNLENIRAVQNYPIPKSVREVQGFVGLCSYFRRFIKDFALHARPLYNLLRKDVVFNFGEKEFKSFELLKLKLLDAPVLSIYNPNSETELHCDASSYGFGAILLQKQKDNKFHPVFYFSKRCSEVESRYHSFELETLAIIYALRRFRVYLLGLEFKIVSDCQSLTLTLNKKHLNPRISRWALELQEYNYRIEHRTSTRMNHVDALSRYSTVLTITDNDFDLLLAAAQKKDGEIRAIAEELEKKDSPSFALFNGQVYRKRNNDLLYYVPEQMEERVIQVHHDNLCHLSTDKCYEYLQRVYWFPEMKSKIASYISKCLKCMYYSLPSGKAEGSLQAIPKGNLPFEILHIDHYGPLPNNSTKYKHILVIVDGFTKYTKLFAVKSTKSQETISCLQTYFSYYSRPTKIVSDRGASFTSEEFSNFIIDNNIQHIKVATLTPHANGQVERVNKVLTPMFSKLSDTDSTGNWHKNLAKVEFAINNTVNRSTGFTPSMLLFGVGQKGEVCDRLLEYLTENKNKDRDLPVIREQAESNIKKNQSTNTNHYNALHKQPYKYKVGDFVMLKNVVTTPGINKKFHPKYKGPYQVVKVLLNDRYLVKDIDNIQISRIPYEGICSPQNMKLYEANLRN